MKNVKDDKVFKGIVKWFNNPKGYGFIKASENTNNEDVMLHYSVIEMEGFKTVKANKPVQYKYVLEESGYKAVWAKPLYGENE